MPLRRPRGPSGRKFRRGYLLHHFPERALGVPKVVRLLHGVIAGRERDPGFTYLRAKGALRIVRADAGIGERTSKYALLTLAEALARGRGA